MADTIRRHEERVARGRSEFDDATRGRSDTPRTAAVSLRSPVSAAAIGDILVGTEVLQLTATIYPYIDGTTLTAHETPRAGEAVADAARRWADDLATALERQSARLGEDDRAVALAAVQRLRTDGIPAIGAVVKGADRSLRAVVERAGSQLYSVELDGERPETPVDPQSRALYEEACGE